MSSIEQILWNYIDGYGTTEGREQINRLIQQDPAYRQQYEAMLLFNNELNLSELDEPPMAFTYKVMEQIRTQEALVPLKAGINKRIIQGIAAFFVLTILIILVFVLRDINWSNSLTAAKITNQLNTLGHKIFFNSVWIKGFPFFDMVLALFVLDGYLRRNMKKSTKVNHN